MTGLHFFKNKNKTWNSSHKSPWKTDSLLMFAFFVLLRNKWCDGKTTKCAFWDRNSLLWFLWIICFDLHLYNEVEFGPDVVNYNGRMLVVWHKFDVRSQVNCGNVLAKSADKWLQRLAFQSCVSTVWNFSQCFSWMVNAEPMTKECCPNPRSDNPTHVHVAIATHQQQTHNPSPKVRGQVLPKKYEKVIYFLINRYSN